jgi:ribonuclease HI
MADAYRDPDRPRLFSLREYLRAEDALYQPRLSDYLILNPSGESFFLMGTPFPSVVFVDGACARNGAPSASGGYGVFFGPNSPYNVSKSLKYTEPQTSQRAELTAALVALNQMERIAGEYGLQQCDFFIICTDSAYVVNSLTSYIYKWRRNDYTAATGREVVNRDLFERLDKKLDSMAYGRQGIDVLFWKVPRDANQDADELAKRAVDW